jgi:hypothetical protein
MPLKWTLVLLIVLIASSIVLGIIDKGAGYGGTNPIETIHALTTTTSGESKGILGIAASFFTDSGAWASALFAMVFFDYAIFNQGYWSTVQYFFWAIGLAWFISLILAIKGTSSS